jgi:hypothetical protein
MTKKHFIQVAKDINSRYRSAEPSERWVIVSVVGDLCDTFKQINPNFDRYKFIEACTDEE